MRTAKKRAPRRTTGHVGRQALELMKDPRSSSASLSRVIEHAPQLHDAIIAYAQVKFRDRGRVRSTQDAITLIGLRQLEQIIVGHLRRQQLAAPKVRSQPNHRIAALQVAPPEDAQSRAQQATSGQ